MVALVAGPSCVHAFGLYNTSLYQGRLQRASCFPIRRGDTNRTKKKRKIVMCARRTKFSPTSLSEFMIYNWYLYHFPASTWTCTRTFLVCMYLLNLVLLVPQG